MRDAQTLRARPRRLANVPRGATPGSDRWRGPRRRTPPFARASRTVKGPRGAACDGQNVAGDRLYSSDPASHPRPRKRLNGHLRFRNRSIFARGTSIQPRARGASPLSCARQTRSRHDRGEEGAAEERRRRPGVRRRVRGIRQRRCVSGSRARRDLGHLGHLVLPDLVGFARVDTAPFSDRPEHANVSDRQSGAPRRRTPRMSNSGRRTGTTPTRTMTSPAS